MTANTIVLNRSLFKKIPYDPVKDFAPVAPLAIASLALVTHPSVKAKTVAEFIALAKANPGRINYGSPGNGTPHHLAMELFKHEAGIELVHVPYRGHRPARSHDLLGGQIGAMFLPVHVALPQVQAGKLEHADRRQPATHRGDARRPVARRSDRRDEHRRRHLVRGLRAGRDARRDRRAPRDAR